ncbi:MAG: class II fructose-bisphosphate aldolase [bacterium]|nr:class II fructose-bisphosphate aldolase [bacterium]
MLAQARDLLEKAREEAYALGAFNTCNLEITQAIVRAAAATRSPLVIQVSETTINYAGLKAITHIVRNVAETEGKDIPVALHLDHGRSFRSIVECIKIGFSSVQIDAADLNFEENVALTRQVVEFAREKGIFVQGEVGRIPGSHGQLKNGEVKGLEYTDPLQAKEYVERTGVDSLAVSVGTSHGLFRTEIRFDILEEIRSLVNIPLVLHGASGETRLDIRKAIRSGVNNINIDTELRVAFASSLKEFFGRDKEENDPRKILAASCDAVQKVVEEKLDLVGSVNKAQAMV